MVYTANDLSAAQRHVEAGERRLNRQRRLIEDLNKAGAHVRAADELLAIMERNQRDLLALLDKIRSELSA